MAIDWRTVLLLVPWNDVLKNAPKVADSAMKLWGSVTKRTPKQEARVSVPVVEPLEPQSIAKLQSRLAAVEETVTELHGQMVASARVIKELADQNERLVGQAEVQRRKIAWLTWAGVVLFVLSAASLFLTLFDW